MDTDFILICILNGHICTSKYFQQWINLSNLFFLTDCVPCGLLQYSILDDISTFRCSSFYSFPGFRDTHVTGCPVIGTADRSSIHVITSKYINTFVSFFIVLSCALYYVKNLPHYQCNLQKMHTYV